MHVIQAEPPTSGTLSLVRKHLIFLLVTFGNKNEYYSSAPFLAPRCYVDMPFPRFPDHTSSLLLIIITYHYYFFSFAGTDAHFG
jgi:hypothetical protein